MIYFMSKYEEDGGLYYLFETNTQSMMYLREEKLISLMVEKNFEVLNLCLNNNTIHIKERKIRLYKLGDMYRILTKLHRKPARMIYRAANREYISKCKIERMFKEQIDSEYLKYITKARLLGMDISFNYTVKGNEVYVEEYTGTSKEVVLPNFITVINSKAFYFKGIEKIKFNAGLKYIGVGAFEINELKYVEIPKTVKLICQDAFRFNKAISKVTHEVDYSKIKLLSKDTIILNEGVL